MSKHVKLLLLYGLTDFRYDVNITLVDIDTLWRSIWDYINRQSR